jgi:hypothetical protein
MSISLRKHRAAIFWYLDSGEDGRSTPRWVKQVNPKKSDGNWFCSRSFPDGHEVTVGAKPEYRVEGKLGFSVAAPVIAEKGVAILMVDTQQIYIVQTVLPRELGQYEQQVYVRLSVDSIKQVEYYIDDYYNTSLG